MWVLGAHPDASLSSSNWPCMSNFLPIFFSSKVCWQRQAGMFPLPHSSRHRSLQGLFVRTNMTRRAPWLIVAALMRGEVFWTSDASDWSQVQRLRGCWQSTFTTHALPRIFKEFYDDFSENLA